jgi:hypothetical protein
MIAIPTVLIAGEAEKVIDDATAGGGDLDLVEVRHKRLTFDIIIVNQNTQRSRAMQMQQQFYGFRPLAPTLRTRLMEWWVAQGRPSVGWASTQMAARYVHPTPERLATLVARLDQPAPIAAFE